MFHALFKSMHLKIFLMEILNTKYIIIIVKMQNVRCLKYKSMHLGTKRMKQWKLFEETQRKKINKYIYLFSIKCTDNQNRRI